MHCFRQSAHPPDIGLNDRALAIVHEFAELVPGLEKFTSSYRCARRTRQTRETFEIVSVKRRFNEEQIGVFDALQNPQRFAEVYPAVTNIDHELAFVANPFPAFIDKSDELTVTHKIVEEHFHLECPRAVRGCLLNQTEAGPLHFVPGPALRHAWEQSEVRGDPLSHRATQKLVNGLLEQLAAKVVQRVIAGGQKHDARTAP